MYPPDTPNLIDHERSVAENARSVLLGWQVLVYAFGGSDEVARLGADVVRDHPALAVPSRA